MNYKQYEALIKGSKMAEAQVGGIIRGGYLVDNGKRFAYCSTTFNVTDNFDLKRIIER